MNKKSGSLGEKLAFLNGLKQYLEDRGKVLVPYPRLAQKVIDLHDLYNQVTSLGGYRKVTKKYLWDGILAQYNFKDVSASLTYGLKTIYRRFLESYERVHYFGEDDNSKRTQLDFSLRKIYEGAKVSVKTTVGLAASSRSSHHECKPNDFISVFTQLDYEREQHGLSVTRSMEKRLLSGDVCYFERLAFSLMSCLPNEVDFAINTCTLLSGESRHVLKLYQCPQVLEALLLHAGIVSTEFGSLNEIAEEWNEKTGRIFLQFWKDTVTDKEVLSLLPDKHYFSSCYCERLNRSRKNTAVERDISAPDYSSKQICGTSTVLENVCPHCLSEKIQKIKDKGNCCKWSSLFQPKRSSGVQDYEGQRVLQIALVLLNLSCEKFNVLIMAGSKPFLRFVFLCIHSNYSSLHQTGLDILGNISTKMDLLQVGIDLLECTYRTFEQCILSPDKFDQMRGFEVLGNLCHQPSNKDSLLLTIRDKIFTQALRLLTLGDVQLMVATLDALYSVSSLGEEGCTRIMLVPSSIDILVCLITVNVRTFDIKLLSKIRIAKKVLPQAQANHAEETRPATASSQKQKNQGIVTSVVPSGSSSDGCLPTPRIPAIQKNQPSSSANKLLHQAPATQSQLLPEVKIQPSQVSKDCPPKVDPASPSYQPSLPPQSKEGKRLRKIAPKSHVSEQVQKAVTKKSESSPTVEPCETKSHQIPSSSQSTSDSIRLNEQIPLDVTSTYIHAESQLVPPVYHYLPAPPSHISLNKTPQTFAQLWIWATYESCTDEESVIARLEIFAKYTAAACRYGMNASAEVLTASEFACCLQRVYPRPSRLSKEDNANQMPYITGIRARKTPLPVPGFFPCSSTEKKNNLDIQRLPPIDHNESCYTDQINQSQSSVKAAIENNEHSFQVSTQEATSPSPASIKQSESSHRPSLSQSEVCDKISLEQTEFHHKMPSQESCLKGPIKKSESCSETLLQSLHENPIQHDETQTSANPLTTSRSALPGQGNDVVSAVACVISKGAELAQKVLQSQTVPSSGLVHSTPPDFSRQNGEGLNKEHGPVNSSKTTNEQSLVTNNLPDLKAKNFLFDAVQVKKSFTDFSETCKKGSLNATEALCKHRLDSTTPKLEIPPPNHCETNVTNHVIKSDVSGYVTPAKKNISPDCMNGHLCPNGKASSAESFVLNEALQCNGKVPPILPDKDSEKSLANNATCSALSRKLESSSVYKDSNGNIFFNKPLKEVNGESTIKLPPSYPKNQSFSFQCSNSMIIISQETPPSTSSTFQPPEQHNPPSVSHSLKVESCVFSTSVAPTVVSSACHIRATPNITSSAAKVNLKRHAPPVVPPHPRKVSKTPHYPVSPLIKQTHRSVPHVIHADGSSSNAAIIHPPTFVKNQVNYSSKSQPADSSIMNSTIPRPWGDVSIPPGTIHDKIDSAKPQALPSKVSSGAKSSYPSPHKALPQTSNSEGEPKPPAVDLMAPDAALAVLLRNSGKLSFEDWSDDNEDPISKSIRLTAVLILINISRYSHEGRSLLQRHEPLFAYLSTSRMDCAPKVAELLSQLDR